MEIRGCSHGYKHFRKFQNVIDAIITAKAKGMTVIGLTGETGGKMKSFCDILINVPEKAQLYVQELHLPVYHTLCLMVENHSLEIINIMQYY